MSQKITKEEAPWREIIATAKKEQSKRLDLGACGLIYIPEEIFEMDWLEELVLGNNSFELQDYDYLKINEAYYNTVFNKEKKFTQNDYYANIFRGSNLTGLSSLKNLRYLNLNGCGLGDLAFVNGMSALEILIVSNNDLERNKEPRLELPGLKVLDICNCNLGNAFRKEVIWFNNNVIEYLNIARNGFFRFSLLNHFQRIKALNASFLPENELPSKWGSIELAGIEFLDISNTGIQALKSFGGLTNLRVLQANNNNISRFEISPLFIQLEEIRLSNNSLTDCSNFPELPKLRILDLSSNKLSNIGGITKQRSLQELYLSSNMYRGEINIDSLHQLKKLDLSSNRLKNLILHAQVKPEHLYINDNLFNNSEKVEDLFHNLPELKTLFIYNNKIEGIPPTYLGSPSHPNALPGLRDYFASLEKGNVINNEVKLILVGNSTAGKTTLRKLLQGKKYDAREDSTHGIISETWKLGAKELKGITDMKELNVHVWDFGGQEYYHETHKLFFSNNAVYVLVWENDTNLYEIKRTEVYEKKKEGKSEKVDKYIEHHNYEFWLRSIRHFAGDSPILMLQNKIDMYYEKPAPGNGQNHKPIRINRVPVKILDEYGVIQAFDVSLKKYADKDADYQYDYQKFERQLRKTLVDAAGRFKLGKRFNKIKNIIESRKQENWWNYEDYEKLCRAEDPQIEITELTRFLADTSVIMHFPNHTTLKNKVFINPIWICDTIYNILDENVLARSGLFAFDDVVKKLANDRAQATTFIDLMKEFQLIFPVMERGNATDRYIAPQYLPEGYTTRSYYLFKSKSGNAKFTLEFPEFLPQTIMNSLLSKYATRSIDSSYFRYGVAFETDGLTGIANIIECDFENSRIEVYSESSNIMNLREIFESILAAYTGFLQKQMPGTGATPLTLLDVASQQNTIHISTDGENYVNWNDLYRQRNELNDNTTLLPVKGNQLTPVVFRPFYMSTSLLESYASVTQQMPEPPKVFVSYSHKDESYKDELLEHLSGLKRTGVIKEWNDRAILSGNRWDGVIRDKLNTADIILFLVSPSFLASDYIHDVEIKTAIEREHNKKVIIVPIHVRPCDFQSLPLKNYQGGTKDMKAVTQNDNRDAAWLEVVNKLRDLIREMQKTPVSS